MTCLGAVILFVIQFGISLSLSPVGRFSGGGFVVVFGAVKREIPCCPGVKKPPLGWLTFLLGKEQCLSVFRWRGLASAE